MFILELSDRHNVIMGNNPLLLSLSTLFFFNEPDCCYALSKYFLSLSLCIMITKKQVINMKYRYAVFFLFIERHAYIIYKINLRNMLMYYLDWWRMHVKFTKAAIRKNMTILIKKYDSYAQICTNEKEKESYSSVTEAKHIQKKSASECNKMIII